MTCRAIRSRITKLSPAFYDYDLFGKPEPHYSTVFPRFEFQRSKFHGSNHVSPSGLGPAYRPECSISQPGRARLINNPADPTITAWSNLGLHMAQSPNGAVHAIGG